MEPRGRKYTLSSTDWPNRSHVGNLERIDRRVSDLDKAWVNTGPRSGQGMGHELDSPMPCPPYLEVG